MAKPEAEIQETLELIERDYWTEDSTSSDPEDIIRETLLYVLGHRTLDDLLEYVR